MTFARQILNALLPRGSAWAPKYDGGFDHLLDGIADCFAILKTVGSALADLRHPMTTGQLDDLEREVGVLTETTLTETVRRVYLHGVVYGDIGTGSDDNLEAHLRAAGFDVHVWQNNPVIDPALLLASTPAATCGFADSTCGYALATCSRSDDGSASLLVNEEVPRVPVLYVVPENSDLWPFIFFVGGDWDGEQFEDWNMERADVLAWPPKPGLATVEKTIVVWNSFFRALKITAGGATDYDDQQIQPSGDPDVVSFYRLNLVVAAIENLVQVGHDGTNHGTANALTPWWKGLEFYAPAGDHVSLDSDKILDGGFDDPGAWTCGANWSVVGSEARHVSGGAGPESITQAGGGLSGLWRITYTVSGYAGAGNFYTSLNGTPSAIHGGDGTWVDYIPVATFGTFAIVAPETASFVVSFVSVELVDNIFANNEITIAGWFKPTSIAAPAVQGIVTNGTADAAGKQGLTIEASQWVFTTVVGGVVKTVACDATEDEWHFVVATRAFDGVNTTLKIYVDAKEMGSSANVGIPNVTNYQTPLVGCRDGAAVEFYEGEMADNITTMAEAASQAWIDAEFARGLAALESGPYVEQELTTPINKSLALSVHSWGDRDRFFPSVGFVAVRNYAGEWEYLTGALGTEIDDNATLTVACPNGISAVRIFCKFTETGFIFLDDVWISGLALARAQVPAELRDKFERLILAGKSVHSWAGMLVDYA